MRRKAETARDEIQGLLEQEIQQYESYVNADGGKAAGDRGSGILVKANACGTEATH